MDISIDAVFVERGIDAALGCIRCRVAVSVDAPGMAEALDAEIEARAPWLAENAPSADPVVASTRKAYKALGKDPARYRPAAESLMRRVKQGKGLYRVNTAVDANNLISIKTGYSIGAYDVAKLAPPTAFRRAGAGDSHVGIGRGPLNLEGLPILSDSQGPFGCPTSDSERTMITESTETLLMVLFDFAGGEGLEEAMDFAVRTLERFASAQGVETAVVRA